MLKGLKRLLLGGIASMSTAQLRQQKQLTKALLGGGKRRKSRKSSPSSLTAKPLRNKGKSAASTSQATASLAGQWITSWYNASIDHQCLPYQRLGYKLYLPKHHRGGPLLVMLHGCGQTANDFALGTRMNALAEKKGFAVLYPQQSLRRHSQRCWPWYERNVQEGGGEVPLIMGAIGTILTQYSLDPSRVYVAGISAGAAMAHILALHYPEQIAAVGLHSGPVYGAGNGKLTALMVMQGGSVAGGNGAMAEALVRFGETLRMPAILLHGHADKMVRPINQQQLVQQFMALNQLQNADVRPSVLKRSGRGRKAHSYQIDDYVVRRKLLLRVCRVSELGHAWSGGDGTIKYHAGNGPDASKLMWDFFARHRRTPLRR
ncbi:PHB depolymerase family esterase [Silvimonas sp.]|uniref:extracellular catalytic domain type 1 short-chain-length polyhydroxyalkanoate depolymerase n=1 Tax=Silvimonas sp. TaxID=2650811 RepID=UPI00284F66C1|nr:PHB depolymerase family esterase [Silvimonas sp.]MDR3428214.1 PHB depolymerase family esterase [Silvimonas sp.]